MTEHGRPHTHEQESNYAAEWAVEASAQTYAWGSKRRAQWRRAERDHTIAAGCRTAIVPQVH